MLMTPLLINHLKNLNVLTLCLCQINSVEVIKVERKGASAVHYALSEFPVGSEVTVKVDWQRRFDHMQQHTGKQIVTVWYMLLGVGLSFFFGGGD